MKKDEEARQKRQAEERKKAEEKKRERRKWKEITDAFLSGTDPQWESLRRERGEMLAMPDSEDKERRSFVK